ncbi:MAG: cobyric acid synthase [Alphaproteobacteria bacterium]|nr:cobyric acid synthase [Alphaproteobacteria bacterium]
MFQGTGSDVGKSVLVAGLCRALKRRGKSILPFKPQNMSNNAAIAEDGTEIGRAQALQALACGVKPRTDMNPVLLKPQSDIGAQLIVNGEVKGNYDARAYQAHKPTLMPEVTAAFNRLRAEADIVLVEGAGSASEVNLRDGDIANMGFATATQTPVILIGDIDRGGVIASIAGTHALLPDDEKRLLKGYLINKFRGDVSLFENAIDILQQRTDLPCFGIVPHLAEARALPAEDSVALERPIKNTADGAINIAVPQLLHIANFDDLDPLLAEPDVSVVMVPPGSPLPGDTDLIILPGTKATIPALNHFRDQGWDIDLEAHIRRGGKVLGICGGYQMLGNSIDDPDGTEGTAGKATALGHLDVDTTIAAPKTLTDVTGTALNSLGAVSGFEMHMGKTTGADTARPFLDLDGRPDGAISVSGQIIGCYVHGLFASDGFRHAFLDRLLAREPGLNNYDASIQETLDAIADHLENALDIDGLLELAASA